MPPALRGLVEHICRGAERERDTPDAGGCPLTRRGRDSELGAETKSEPAASVWPDGPYSADGLYFLC